jgi:hypothetical protein
LNEITCTKCKGSEKNNRDPKLTCECNKGYFNPDESNLIGDCFGKNLNIFKLNKKILFFLNKKKNVTLNVKVTVLFNMTIVSALNNNIKKLKTLLVKVC